jgi:hypothetical protein
MNCFSWSTMFFVAVDDALRVSHEVTYKQMRFNPGVITHKTMKTMDHAARLAMLPDYEIYCVDLTEGNVMYFDVLRRNVLFCLIILL